MEKDATGVYNIACCSRINLLELADMITKITGMSIPITFTPRVKGDVRDLLADVTLAKKSIGYALRWSVRKGLEEMIGYYQK